MGDTSAFKGADVVQKQKNCVYTKALFTYLLSEMLAARLFSFKQETVILIS